MARNAAKIADDTAAATDAGRIAAAEKALAEYREQVRATAMRYGNDYGYQRRVDRLLVELGLEGYPKQARRTITWTAQSTVTIDADSDEEAKTRFDNLQRYMEVGSGYNRENTSPTDFQVVKIEEAEGRSLF